MQAQTAPPPTARWRAFGQMWSSPKRSRVHAGADDATDERALTLLYTSWGEEQEERLCDASPGDWSTTDASLRSL